jgi:hypothetical protein
MQFTKSDATKSMLNHFSEKARNIQKWAAKVNISLGPKVLIPCKKQYKIHSQRFMTNHKFFLISKVVYIKNPIKGQRNQLHW